MTTKVHRYFFRYKPLDTVFQFEFFLHLTAVSVIPRVIWAHQYIYLLCIGRELKGPTMTWDAARIFMQNLEYLDLFKMHSPSWSFGKPFSKKIGFDIWMSTLIQQFKNRHANDTDYPWWVRSNPIICNFQNLSIFKYIPYSTCCLLLFFLLNTCSLGKFNKFLANF